MEKKKQAKSVVYPAMIEIGFRISIPLVLFTLLGVWLDKTFRTSPLFLFLGIFFSLFMSAYGIYGIYKKYIKGNK
ncbi:hypothetical protein COX95_05005 [bacterium CG_4_10_14_0_2_um_filter_33_32]|nr:MAG: hypothetical protein AUJ93_00940 [bacterium CG2_30_33_46]PIR67901.1 MAG: hypothetical protein COU50_00890 [bacterium CG10_big_fil_rev_8_21_14_0_10_33_18]PIU76322.1 MAG: hypothetical protein COS74_04705 [bacterium CG06_land_8_20_14_3_00_33_50]PIW81014.1 MAG: hypothetical protein COZ97_04035 [bacterium CG_4_8_14_3_um_filter_33_28]PIY85464.1 MAG: hypothetical protein COY76_02120 [bacterium CG_4_10_14_0_8_um_filter_33_57]PIZ85189.1 MAG: hypothetical protein COX95_05005 [bacterium CG_4_10_1